MNDGSRPRVIHQVFSIQFLVLPDLSLVKCCSPLSRSALSDAQAGELERVFKALADRHRVKILNRLIAAGDEAVCVCEFTDSLGLKQPTVSYHLKQLADAGLISRERRGTFAYYRLVPGALEGLGALLATPARAAAA
jgi:ArsR family transcriptional regulator, arsenate/arsenite/antimonite-responsive transcriptional repressor